MAQHNMSSDDEVVYHQTTLDLGDRVGRVKVSVVFDCQARPHLIVMCRALSGKRCGCQGKERPSYWHLDPRARLTLTEFQLSCMRKVAEELSLPEGSVWAEIHLGSWVSSKTHYIHSHIVLPAPAYFDLMQIFATPGNKSLDMWQEKYRTYLEKERDERERWFPGDAEDAKRAMSSRLHQTLPQGGNIVRDMLVSPDTPVFDVSLPTTDSLVLLDDFVKPRLTGCFYLIPFRQKYKESFVVRVICPPGDFVKAFSTPQDVQQWHCKWLERGAQWIERAYETLDNLA
jgi:hypothetical protein